MEDHRARRVSEAVKEELAELIGFEMDDPRLASVNVTSADVSSDMRHAHVKVAIEAGRRRRRWKPGARQRFSETRTGVASEPAADPGSSFCRRHPSGRRKPDRFPSPAGQRSRARIRRTADSDRTNRCYPRNAAKLFRVVVLAVGQAVEGCVHLKIYRNPTFVIVLFIARFCPGVLLKSKAV